MAPAVEPREHTRGGKLSDRSISPVTKRRSPRQRSSPRRERSPGRQRSSSPSRTKSPQRNNTAYRRLLGKDKLLDQAVQPKPDRGRLPMRSSSSQSPSPRMKRTRKAQTERESEKVTSREDGRISREERKKGREREFREKERTSSSPSPSPRTKRLMRVQSDRESEKVTSRGDGRNSRDERKKGSDREVKEKERSTSSRSPSPRTRRLMRVQTDRDAEKVTSKEDERNSRDERKKGRERENRDQERTSNSRSPSPRRKRLMRAQAEREVEKVKDRERGRNTTKEERDKGRSGEHGNTEDILNERRSMRDRKEGGPARSSRRDRDRSFSPKEHSERIRHGSSSRSPSRMSRAHAREEVSNSRVAEDSRESDIDSVARMKAAEESLEAKEKDKQKPSFELSGKLAEETNRVRGITLLFNEPADARKPDVRWRLYVFKGGEVLNEPLYVHRQSCYLFGRERRVADIPTDHPSCSKQHAVIQYRLVEKEQPDGLMSKQSRVCHFARELGQLSFLAYSRVVKLFLTQRYLLFDHSTFWPLANSTNSSCLSMHLWLILFLLLYPEERTEEIACFVLIFYHWSFSLLCWICILLFALLTTRSTILNNVFFQNLWELSVLVCLFYCKGILFSNTIYKLCDR